MRLVLLLAIALALSLAAAPSARSAEGLPKDVLDLIAAHDKDVAEVLANAQKEIKKKQEALADKIEAIQKKYTMEGKLDEAVAIRDHAKAIRAGTRGIEKDTGSLSKYRGRVGETILIEVTGATTGWIFGDGVYTDDSVLATAVVHAGILKFGDKGIVKVTLMPGKNSYEGTEKNGVRSSSWGSWEMSYKVEAVGLTQNRTEEKKGKD